MVRSAARMYFFSNTAVSPFLTSRYNHPLMTIPRGAVVLAAAAVFLPGLCSGQDKGTPVFGTTVVIPSGLRGLVYYMRPGEAWLPDFARLKPAGAIYTTTLDVPAQDFLLGFPGITNRNEWFAIDYSGRFWIAAPGEYQFSLMSDDGSKLYIDDRTVINNDGTHAPETVFARIKLDCGIHRIRVSYFQGPRFQVALVLSISGGGKKWRVFSTEEFKPPPNPEDWACGGAPVTYDPNRRKLSDVVGQAIPGEAEALAALDAHPRPRDLGVRSAGFSFWQGPDGSQASLAVAVPGAALTAKLDPAAKAQKVSIAILSLVKAEDGHVVDRYRQVAPYEIPEAAYAAVRARDLVFSHPVHLPPGRYTIETAVVDLESRRIGTAEAVLESPPQRNGIGMSSLVLVEAVEPAAANADAADPLVFSGKRVVPHLAPGVDAAAKPLIYFVVYPDAANPAKPSIRVQFFNGGALIAEKTQALPAPDASGAIPCFSASPPAVATPRSELPSPRPPIPRRELCSTR
jgi:hypothetical protein